MKKKIISIFMISIMLLGMTGCGNNEGGSSGGVFSDGLKTKDLSIEDFAWETKETRIDGKKSYAMTITNNSEYDILGAEIYYELKDSVTEDDLKLFDDFMNDHADWFDEDETAEDVTLVGSRNKLVKKGETLDQVILYVGMGTTYWYDRPTEEQFELMQPYELQLAVIGKDNKAYVVYYEFDDEEWSIDETTKDMNTWAKNDLADKVVKPTCDYYMLTSEVDDDDDLDFTCYGTTKEYFKQYAEETRKAGFDVDAPEENDYETYYSAENKDGVSISITYNKDSETFKVSTYAG